MSNLQQLKLNYDPVQDRLLLIFITNDLSQLRFWITRHMTKNFLDGLKQLQTTLHQTPHEVRQDKEKAEQNVQRETVNPEASKYGMTITRNPIGAEPVLLSQVQINILENKQIHFRFESVEGAHVDMTFEAGFVASLIHLFDTTLDMTDWKLT